MGLCTFWDPVGPLNRFSCETGTLLCCHNLHWFLQLRDMRLYIRCWNPRLYGLAWGWNCPLPCCPSQFLSTMCECGAACSSGHCLAARPLYPGCLSVPLLPIWVNVSFLTHCLSDFHIVQFSGSCGCFLFLDWLLSFLLLCSEGKHVYLHLHLGRKSWTCS